MTINSSKFLREVWWQRGHIRRAGWQRRSGGPVSMAVLILHCTMDHAKPGHQRHRQRQQKPARIYECECSGTLPSQRAGILLPNVDVEEGIIVWHLWSLSILSPAIDTNLSVDINSWFGIVFRQKGPVVACDGGLAAGAWPFNAYQVRSSASYRWRDQVRLGLPPFL